MNSSPQYPPNMSHNQQQMNRPIQNNQANYTPPSSYSQQPFQARPSPPTPVQNNMNNGQIQNNPNSNYVTNNQQRPPPPGFIQQQQRPIYPGPSPSPINMNRTNSPFQNNNSLKNPSPMQGSPVSNQLQQRPLHPPGLSPSPLVANNNSGNGSNNSSIQGSPISNQLQQRPPLLGLSPSPANTLRSPSPLAPNINNINNNNNSLIQGPPVSNHLQQQPPLPQSSVASLTPSNLSGSDSSLPQISNQMQNMSIQDSLNSNQLQQQQPIQQQNKPGRSKRVYAPLNQNSLPNSLPPTPPPKTEPVLQQFNQIPPQPTQYQHLQQQVQPQQQLNQNNNNINNINGYPNNAPSMEAPPPPPKNKIDPNQIPAPPQLQMKDQEYYLQNDYGTCSKESLPLACTDFKTVDQGNSNPRFIRSNLREIPQNTQLLLDSKIPFGVIVQPLAKLHSQDDPILLASTTEDGPMRCNRCKGYINPWCSFIDGGRKFVCNLCGFDNDVPSDYFGPLDMSGKRMDMDQRPELQFGTVEFKVPSLYWTRQPAPLHVLFAIDVSWSAIQSGMLLTFCETLKKILYQDNKLDPNVKIGIVTYDITIQFYNLNATLEQASMMVVSDIEEVFIPLSDGLFVNPQKSRTAIEDLLDNLPNLYSNTKIPKGVFMPVIQGALMALKPNGGKLHIFHTSLPNTGPGALKNRDDVKLYGTEKEKQLYVPQNNDYHSLGIECVNEGICVDLWLFPIRSYVDVCTLGVLSALSGGDTHYFPDFDKNQHGYMFTHDLQHSLQREQGYNGALRLRCSNGLKIDDQYGNFYMTNSTDIELGGIDSDKSIAFAAGLDGKLTENSQVYFQCALLYTTQSGERRVRVHNLALSVTSAIGTVFKNADFDTTVNFISKKAITNSITRGTETISNDLDRECIKILTSYRRNCASSAAPGQLILPESFKMLPLVSLGLKKSQVLRKDLSLNPDQRVYNMRKMKSLGISGTIKWFYPTMVQLNLLFIMNPEQPFIWPLERLSYQRLKSNGIYFLDAIDKRFIWIGNHTQSDYLQGLFGVERLDQINTQLNELPILENDISDRYHQLLNYIDNSRTWAPKLSIVRQGLDTENEFVKVLVEDETFNQMSYVDYLCLIHKRIQSELEREKHENLVSSTSYWAYRY